MPAKVKSTRVVGKSTPVAPVVDTPHPQILSQAQASGSPPEEQAQPEDLEAMLEDTGDESVLDQKNSILFTVGAIVTVAIIVATLSIFVIYLNAPKVITEAVVEKQTEVTAPTPTQKPTPVTVEVLNGSGVAGKAAKGAGVLTDHGYTVVATGNTKKQATTELFVSSSLQPAAISSLLSDMTTLFGVGSNSGDLVGSTATARLILGSK